MPLQNQLARMFEQHCPDLESIGVKILQVADFNINLSDEDEETLRILTHVHTRLQEELEKKTEPALALLHKLTRTSAAPIRGNILRHNLVPGGAAVDGVIKLPDGTELPVDAAKAKALVTPAAFADAVSDTLEKVRLMGVERRVLEETAEEIRQVAKEARAVIEEAYDGETLDAFSEEDAADVCARVALARFGGDDLLEPRERTVPLDGAAPTARGLALRRALRGVGDGGLVGALRGGGARAAFLACVRPSRRAAAAERLDAPAE